MREKAEGVGDLAWSPDGALLAVGGEGHGALAIWDTTDPSRPMQVHGPVTVSADAPDGLVLAWAPHGRTLAILDRTDVILWSFDEPAKPVELARVSAPYATDVIWSPDGRQLGVIDGYAIQLWDVTDRRQPRPLGPTFNEEKGLYALGMDPMPASWAPDAPAVATASHGSMARLWDVSDPTAATPIGDGLAAHTDNVVGVAWSPTGDVLATLDLDRNIAFWDVAYLPSPRQIGPTITLPGDMASGLMAWSPDGRFLLAVSDTRALIWDLRGLHYLREHAVERACAAAGGGLTPEQWAQFITTLPYQPTCPETGSAASNQGAASPADRTGWATAVPIAIAVGTTQVIVAAGTALALAWWVLRRRRSASDAARDLRAPTGGGSQLR